MNLGREELLAGLMQPVPVSPGPRPELGALLDPAAARKEVTPYLKVLEKYVPADTQEELREYLQCALLGVSIGFLERNLSPYVKQHLTIIPALLEDIRVVYQRLHDMGAEYDREEFRYRAYDYGIHKACYLDWTLYLSGQCY